MNAKEPDSSESQMHLESMLYLLDDPALDRGAFEARLIDDAQLSEILASAVVSFHVLKSCEPEQHAVRPAPVSRPAMPILRSIRYGLFVPAVAASLCIGCFLGWQIFESFQTGKTHSQLSASLNSVVLAWGDLQADSNDSNVQETSDREFTSALSGTDLLMESEVPDWLVLAATETIDSNDSVDAKVFFQ
jgi:hypothetical protein